MSTQQQTTTITSSPSNSTTTTTTNKRNKPPKRELSSASGTASAPQSSITTSSTANGNGSGVVAAGSPPPPPLRKDEKAWLALQPRKVLHIQATDFIQAAFNCMLPDALYNRNALIQRIESFWSPNPQQDHPAYVCLSVRTGFDLMLQALNFPKGSEIMICAVNIDSMFQIIEQHGHVPVPLDLNTATVAPRLELLQQALSPKTKVLYLTYLFGTRFDIAPFITFARNNNLIVVEDCAQAYGGPNYYRGHPDADVSMFSFGSIKTGTALGGALFRVKDRDLLAKMRQIEATYPKLGNMWFLKRLAKYSVLHAFSWHAYTMGPLLRSLEYFGINSDEVITSITRGFPGSQILKLIRHQPPTPMLRLLEKQLTGFDHNFIAQRVARGDKASELLGDAVERPGEAQRPHVYWLFPIVVGNPTQLIEKLFAAGFDATQGSSQLSWVQTPIPGDPTRSAKLYPVASQRMLTNLVYIPVYPQMSEKEVVRLCDIVKRYAVPFPGRPVNDSQTTALPQAKL